MSPEDTKILELNQHQKSDKATFNIYADVECIIEKIVEIILKIYLQQEYENIFHQDFHCVKYLYLEA